MKKQRMINQGIFASSLLSVRNSCDTSEHFFFSQ